LTTPSFVEELSFLSRTSKVIRPSLFLKWVWPRRDHPSSYLSSNYTEAEYLRIDTLVESNFSGMERSHLRVADSLGARGIRTSTLEKRRLFSITNDSSATSLSYAIFTFVLAILAPDGPLYVLGKACPRIVEDENVNAAAEYFCQVPPLRGDDLLHLFPLTPSVRRVACYHNCSSSCQLRADAFTCHSTKIVAEGLFRVHTLC